MQDLKDWIRLLSLVLGTPAVKTYKAAHAYGPQPPRPRRRGGRSRWEGHRIRKARRLEA